MIAPPPLVFFPQPSTLLTAESFKQWKEEKEEEEGEEEKKEKDKPHKREKEASKEKERRGNSKQKPQRGQMKHCPVWARILWWSGFCFIILLSIFYDFLTELFLNTTW